MKRKNKRRSNRLTKPKVWNLFAPLIKDVLEAVFGNKCVTCGKEDLVGYDRQLGHFRSQAGHPRVRWWIKNLGLQCSSCNGPKYQGKPYEFSLWVAETYGQQGLEELIFLSNGTYTTTQATYIDVLTRVKEYNRLISDRKMTHREVYEHILETNFGL